MVAEFLYHKRKCMIKKIIKKEKKRGFLGGAVVKNPPANAAGHGFDPWSRKIPHAAEQLSLCATTTEPAL